MASLDTLPPDQRAVLQLVLQRGRSYDEIARLLSIDPGSVRERAHAALDALGPQTRLPPESRVQIAEYLLGQLSQSDAEPTRRRLAESASERAWARVVSAELAPIAGGRLPSLDAAPRRAAAAATAARAPSPSLSPARTVVPDPDPDTRRERRRMRSEAEPAAEASASKPRKERQPLFLGRNRTPKSERERKPKRERERKPLFLGRKRTPKSERETPGSAPTPEPRVPRGDRGGAERRISRFGGAVLLAGGIVLAAVLAVVLLSGGGKSAPASNSAAAAPVASSTTSSRTSTAASVIAQINLSPPAGRSKAAGIAEVLRQGATKGIAIVAEHVTPNATKPPNAYAVWLYNSAGDARILGFVNPGVGQNGRLSTAGGLPTNASRFKQLVVTLETSASPKTPGTIVLQGKLTGV